MPTVFIIHGAYGHPEENWIPWLKSECERKGWEVIVPRFPTPENQNRDSWLEIVNQYWERMTPDSLFVGHSVGCAFILNLLERLKARAVFLVSGFTGLLGLPLDQINKTLSDRTFDWEAIRRNCPSFTVFHSDNDPYVPLEKAEELARNLNTRVLLIPGAGHFNESAGYVKFPQLWEHICLTDGSLPNLKVTEPIR